MTHSIKTMIATSLPDLATKAANELFDAIRTSAHELDDQLEEAGIDNAQFLMLLLSRLANQTLEYASYMSAGVFCCTHNEDMAREAVKMLLRDQKIAAQHGLDRAIEQATIIMDSAKESEEAVADLLKRASKTCH